MKEIFLKVFPWAIVVIAFLLGLGAIFARCQAVPAVKEPVSRILADIEFGNAGLGYKKPYLGYGVTWEQDFGKRFETQVTGWASHTGKLDGTKAWEYGWNSYGIFYPHRRFGILAGGGQSYLRDEAYRKSTWEYSAGTRIVGHFMDMPTWLDLTYTQQVGKYDPRTGIEPNKLKGFEIYPEFRFAELGPVAMRLGFKFAGYHGYNQGNPQCDGTLGPVQSGCARAGFWTGSGLVTVRFEFPRAR